MDKIKRELHDFYEISTSTWNACYQKHITWWHCVPYTLNIYKHVLNVWILKNSQECNMTINLVRCCSVRNVFQRISWQTTLPKFYSSPCPWRLSDQMVTVLVSRLREPGSRLGLVIVLCSWVKQFALTVSISNQEYIWILEMCQDTW